MPTFEVLEKPWELHAVPAAVTHDYVEAKKIVKEKGGDFYMRERFMAMTKKAYTAEVYAFNFNTHGGWANFTLCEETGEFHIQSDWGDWQYSWPQPGRGKGTLKDFIMRTGTCYLAGKLTKGGDEGAKDFDADATIEKIKADPEVKKLLDADEFLADALDELNEFSSCESFMLMLSMKDDLEEVVKALGDDWHCHTPVYKPNGRYLILRDSLLIFFQRFLKEKLNA